MRIDLSRRELAGLATGLGVAMLAGPAAAATGPLRPPRLKAGDRVGLIEPASATFEAFDVTLVEEAVRALGLVPVRGSHVLGRNGYLSASDKDRAADFNAMAADRQIRAILAIRGGWGCARMLPFVDFGLMRTNPKLVIGYSDITALHMAIQAKAGIVSLHAPVGVSSWGSKSVASFRAVAFEGATPDYVNPDAGEDRLVQRKWRTQSIRGGKARGRLLGGNLTVLSALVGTPYLPDFTGAILFLEDIGEAQYRIDRMLTQLALSGMLAKLSGIIFGQCTDCDDKNVDVGNFTVSEVLRQHFEPLGIPCYQGAFIGHMADQYSVPQGVMAQMDADAGSFRLLEPAVA